MSMKKKRNQSTLKADIYDQLLADDVKQGVDIVSLFASFGVQLTQKGSSFIGHCPFHADQNPSLSVDQAKGLFNCFGCGESGDVISLVQKMKGLDFKAAMDYLNASKSGVVANNSPLKLSVSDKAKNTGGVIAPAPADRVQSASSGDPKEHLNLTRIVDYYHKKLYENEKALSYLDQRGIKKRELYSLYRLGFADGSLLDQLGVSQKETVKHLGLIHQSGHETFNQCLIFPLFNALDEAVGLYGRNIDPNARQKHLYLKGKHKGLFNPKSVKVYDEIIITESIIDALSLLEIGVNNVISSYGVNGFCDIHLNSLKEGNVKSVIIAYDGDEAGQRAGVELKERLVRENFAVKIITPTFVSAEEPVKDWNQALVDNHLTRERVEKLILEAHSFEPKQGSFEIEEDGIHTVFRINEITYRISGLKEMFISHLKVKISAQTGDDYFPDTVDLCANRSRLTYCNTLAARFNVEARRIENDLLQILRYQEEKRDQKIVPGKKTGRELSEEEKELGLSFLKNPALIEETIKDITLLGYTGEDSNKLLAYLIGLSRFMDKPLSLYVLSSPGSGKSYLVETIIKLFPSDAVKRITSISDQGFPYLPQEDFQSKIFVMGEDHHSPIVENYIRQMQSEGRLNRDVVKKDEKTGEMQTVTLTHKVKLVFMNTSTRADTNIENISRCILLKVDESSQQTSLVLKTQREGDDFLSQLDKMHLSPDIIKKHITSQLLLKKIKIYNPYARYIHFPTHKALFRRSQPYFLILIKTICYWRQYQKQAVFKENPYTQLEEEWYECDLIDYKIARDLFLKSNLLSYIEELPQGLTELYEQIREMVREKSRQNNLAVVETSFIQKEVREQSDLSNDQIKRYLRKLVEYEYLQLLGGHRHGTRYSYQLREDLPIDQINPGSIIPTVAELSQRIKSGAN